MISRATTISLWLTALVSAYLLYTARISTETAFMAIVCLLAWIWYSIERQLAKDRAHFDTRLESIEQKLLRIESAPIHSTRMADGLSAMIAEMDQVNRFWNDGQNAK